MTIDDIEKLPAGQARIAAYRQYVEAHPNHPVGWYNFAVELERTAEYGEARRAAGRLRAISADLYRTLPKRVHELVGDELGPMPKGGREIAGYRITGIVSVSESHVLFGAVRVSDGTPVTLRRVLDLSFAGSRAAFEAELGVPHPDGMSKPSAIIEDDDGAPLLVLDRVHGDTLRGETRSGALDADVAVRLIRSAAATVVALHEARTLHGDLRPDHLVRGEPGSERLKLIGARAAGADLPTPFGRFAWQSPEEAAGEAPAPPSDVYGLGLLLWHLASAKEPPPLADRGAMPPVAADWPELDALIRRAMAKNPAERPTAPELLRALDDLMIRRELPPVVGKWRLGEQIGEGAFGRVFAGENIEIAGLVAAVKVLNPYMARDRELRGRFLNEASAASRIDHPSIVRVIDGGTLDDGTCYIAMERLVGADLAALIAKGPVAVERVLRLGAQAASALQAAHTAGIVHRDLKPGNLFVVAGPDGDRIEILDFGVALLRGEASREGTALTSTGRLLGTPEYMSPEQWQSAADIDGRADIYGLGVVLWEALAGRHPYRGTTPFEWQQAHLTQPVPGLVEAAPAVPPRLAALVERMMAKRREDRPASMAEVEAELNAIADEERKKRERPAPPPPPPPPPPPAPPIGKWLLLGGGALVALIGAVVLVRCASGGHPTGVDAGPPPRDAGVARDAAPPDAPPPDAAAPAIEWPPCLRLAADRPPLLELRFETMEPNPDDSRHFRVVAQLAGDPNRYAGSGRCGAPQGDLMRCPFDPEPNRPRLTGFLQVTRRNATVYSVAGSVMAEGGDGRRTPAIPSTLVVLRPCR